mmetsp:Transcript_87166/g.255128  ORF Transcript_87166/g.255128 Transcript_87166/m.255128 type:complete len:328 (+) Transcript_87166:1109-2092(+)
MSERHCERMSAATATSVSSSHSRAKASKKWSASILARPASLVRFCTMVRNSSSVCCRCDCSMLHWCSARFTSAPTSAPSMPSLRLRCAALRRATRPPRSRTPTCARKRLSSASTASLSLLIAASTASSEGICAEPSGSSNAITGARCFRSSGTMALGRWSWSRPEGMPQTRPRRAGEAWGRTPFLGTPGARCAAYSASFAGWRTSRKSRAMRVLSQLDRGSSLSKDVAGTSSSTCRASSPWRCCRSTWLKTRQTSSASCFLDFDVLSNLPLHLSSNAFHSLAKMRWACSSAMACEDCQSSSMVFLKWTLSARSWSRSTASVRQSAQV